MANKSAALAAAINGKLAAWRLNAPAKADAVKSLDGWIRDAGIIGDAAAVEYLRQAVAAAEKVGAVKSASPWGKVIKSAAAAVKVLKGATVKADAVTEGRRIVGRFLARNRGTVQTPGDVDDLVSNMRRLFGGTPTMVALGQPLQYLDTVGDDAAAIPYVERVLRILNRLAVKAAKAEPTDVDFLVMYVSNASGQRRQLVEIVNEGAEEGDIPKLQRIADRVTQSAGKLQGDARVQSEGMVQQINAAITLLQRGDKRSAELPLVSAETYANRMLLALERQLTVAKLEAVLRRNPSRR